MRFKRVVILTLNAVKGKDLRLLLELRKWQTSHLPTILPGGVVDEFITPIFYVHALMFGHAPTNKTINWKSLDAWSLVTYSNPKWGRRIHQTKAPIAAR